ncbi:hypothetical protein DM01DRAFT_1336753 [Hesseltinella vesiculosa]|uniref:Vacuolar protein sorting-associated protein 51 homolog n=1 Tax=Hesseltinella vesiculosa TaxID=101127 RepID=A0A1X2GF47_9FUNG|nr:hypothetical protein DM01DRAFT_1336753 [Hesseltinella vesiculosa]
MTSLPDKPKRRERNTILKKYYGLAASQPAKADPMNMDDAYFDGLKYFAKLVKEQPLNNLIKADNDLVAEVQEIEGDMKTLVYENYSKFISATDTIRKMKSNVEQMESAMDKLNEKIQTISVHNKAIHGTLQPNRQKIQQLDSVHHQLQRLEFIFALPSRLQQCETDGNYTQAVKYYARARKLLDHYQDMPTFQSIELECASIMDNIKSHLWQRIKDPDTPFSDINDQFKLLVLLKEDPPALWSSYTDVGLAWLESQQAAAPDSTNALISHFLIPLENLVRQFKSLFLSNKQGESETGSVLHLSLEDHDQAQKHLLAKLQPRLEAVFNHLTNLVDSTTTEDRVVQLEMLMDISDALVNVPALCTVAGIVARFDKYMVAWEDKLVDDLILTIPTSVKERIDTFFKEEQSNDTMLIRRFLDDFSIWFSRHLKTQALLPLQTCLRAMTDACCEQFLPRMQQAWKSMWIRLADSLLATPLDASTLLTNLSISRLCYNFADHDVLQCYRDVSTMLYGVPVTYDTPDASLASHLISDTNDMMGRFAHVGKKLLNEQIRVDGYALGARVQRIYENDHVPSTITQVTPTCAQLLSHLKTVGQWMHAIFPMFSDAHPSHHQRHRESSNNNHSLDDTDASDDPTLTPTNDMLLPTGLGLLPALNPGSDMTMNLMSNIDKLFAAHVDIYSTVDPAPALVLGSLVRMVLKAFQESVRQTPAIDTDFYQQLQVDLEFMLRGLWSLSMNEKWVHTMLLDVMTNAYHRCAEPAHLSPDDVQKIIARNLDNIS